MTKNKIIAATIKNFSEYGYHGTSIRKIAAEVDIKPASIYYFFANKRELLIEAVKVILNHHFDVMKTAFDQHVEDKIDTLFSELLKAVVQHHTANEEETDAYIMIIGSQVETVAEEVQSYLTSYNDWLVERLQKVLKDNYPMLGKPEIKDIISHFIFIGNGLFWGVVIYDEEELQHNLDLAIKLMKHYLQYKTRSEQIDK